VKSILLLLLSGSLDAKQGYLKTAALRFKFKSAAV
jgi:hypothetical protein